MGVEWLASYAALTVASASFHGEQSGNPFPCVPIEVRSIRVRSIRSGTTTPYTCILQLWQVFLHSDPSYCRYRLVSVPHTKHGHLSISILLRFRLLQLEDRKPAHIILQPMRMIRGEFCLCLLACREHSEGRGAIRQNPHTTVFENAINRQSSFGSAFTNSRANNGRQSFAS